MLRSALFTMVLSAAVLAGTAGLAPATGTGPAVRHNRALSAVDFDSPTDGWAVGRAGGCCSGDPYARRFDGVRWQDMNLPSASADDRLHDVAARTPRDVWAVGESVTMSGGRERTLVEHWDGATWSVVPSPTVDPLSVLRGVAAIAADDVWAVGTYWAGHWAALLEHWDGRAWTVVEGPDVGSDDVDLASVSALSSNDVWAVGNACAQAVGATIEHWNGHRWAVVESAPLKGLPCLDDVVAIDKQDIWVVGEHVGRRGQAIAEHWDGASWSVVPAGVGALRSVAAASSDDVWAVGEKESKAGHPHSLVEHWDGQRWSAVDAPWEQGMDWLSGVSAVSGSEAFAVGEAYLKRARESASTTIGWNGTYWEHCGKGCFAESPS